jgi:uroporphyrinogen decarboxylase
MDPQFLYRSPDELRAEVKRILAAYGAGSGHIFNLGHGILPDVSPEQVAVLVDAVHEFSRPYHKS